MNLSHSRRRVALIASLFATSLCGAGFATTMVNALAPGSAAAGGVTLDPSTGESSVTFAMSFATVQACPGDAPAGYLWGTFLTSAANDPATLTFTASGNPVGTGGFTTALRDPFGAPIRNKNPNLVDGIVSPPNQVSFAGAAFVSAPAGDYWIGIACTKADANSVIQNVKFWATKITITSTAGAGPNNFTFGPASTGSTTTTTVAGSTTTTTVAGATTTTTVAGGTTTTVAATTTTVAGATTTVAAQAATLTPAVPIAGAPYKVTHPNCRVGDTITVTQPQSTPTSATATCALEQAAAIGTATVAFTAAPTTPGTYTVTSTGATSGTRTATFVIVGTTPTTLASTGGSSSGGSNGLIPATGSSTTSIIVWGILLLVFGRMAILLGRKPKVIPGNR